MCISALTNTSSWNIGLTSCHETCLKYLSSRLDNMASKTTGRSPAQIKGRLCEKCRGNIFNSPKNQILCVGFCDWPLSTVSCPSSIFYLVNTLQATIFFHSYYKTCSEFLFWWSPHWWKLGHVVSKTRLSVQIERKPCDYYRSHSFAFYVCPENVLDE